MKWARVKSGGRYVLHTDRGSAIVERGEQTGFWYWFVTRGCRGGRSPTLKLAKRAAEGWLE